MSAKKPSIQMKWIVKERGVKPKKGEWYLDDGRPKLQEWEYSTRADYTTLKLVYCKIKGILEPAAAQDTAGQESDGTRFFRSPIRDFAFTGEMRLPKKGESFCIHMSAPPETCDFDYQHNRQRIVVPLSKAESKNLVFTLEKNKAV